MAWWRCVLIGALTILSVSNPAQAQVAPAASAPANAEGVLDEIQISGSDLKVRGWAGAGDSANLVTGIRLLVDGVEIYSGGFEKQPRPDVAQAKGRSDWAQSGLLLQAPLKNPLPEGPRKFTATALLKNGDHFDLRVPEESVTLGLATPTDQPSLLGHLDEVVLEGGQLKVRGWAAWPNSGQKPQVILLRSGEETLYRGEFQIEERPDVATALGKPDLVNSGWIVRLDWSGKPAPSSITPQFEMETGEILSLPLPIAGQAPSAQPALPAPSEELMGTRLAWLAAFLLAGGLGVVVYRAYQRRGNSFSQGSGRYTQSRLITLCLGFALALMCLVALKSQFNAHPDEAGHFNAVNYYSQNWLKQNVDSPEMLKSLIPGWGISYLHIKDFTYFFNNKISSVLSPLGLESFVKYRLFSILLFLVMLIVFKDRTWEGFCFLVCANLVPQIWYIFSYINGDALSFFITMLTCYYFVTNKVKIVDSFWNRKIYWRQVFWFILLCSGVLFVRLQYFIVVPFVLAMVFILGLNNFSKHAFSRFFVRIGIFILVLASVYFVDKIIDESVNGFRKAELLLEIRKSYADPTLSKENILKTGLNPHLLFCKEFGISFYDLFFTRNLNWFTISFQSFIGKFGYMSLNCSHNFYLLSTIFVIIPTGVTVCILIFLCDWKLKLAHILGALTIATIIIQAMIYSWVYAYQAQGRYLFAIFPVLATILSLSPWKQPAGITRKWFLLVLILNIYGYICYAVNKLSFPVM